MKAKIIGFIDLDKAKKDAKKKAIKKFHSRSMEETTYKAFKDLGKMVK